MTGVCAKVNQWPNPTDNIDRLVEDPPGHGTIATIGRLHQSSLDSGLKHRRARRQYNGSREKTGVAVKPGHDEIAEDLHHGGKSNGPFVSVAI